MSCLTPAKPAQGHAAGVADARQPLVAAPARFPQARDIARENPAVEGLGVGLREAAVIQADRRQRHQLLADSSRSSQRPVQQDGSLRAVQDVAAESVVVAKRLRQRQQGILEEPSVAPNGQDFVARFDWQRDARQRVLQTLRQRVKGVCQRRRDGAVPVARQPVPPRQFALQQPAIHAPQPPRHLTVVLQRPIAFAVVVIRHPDPAVVAEVLRLNDSRRQEGISWQHAQYAGAV